MFESLLIANRGEIACRVIRTARRMGVRTVAVYSEADRDAQHVQLADSAICIGGAPAGESYLNQAAVIDAAIACGAEAIHPGYGFLSENAAFAEACAAAELIFVGPTPDAIRRMGSKDEAKSLARTAGVPVIPGFGGAETDDADLLRQAENLGFPLLIKAVAGGGGKGMRRVDGAEGFADALTSARREAVGAFGSDAVLLERFIERPRHVEVQVFGDRHGNLVHLFERDCSVQRRHQKVIEEAPSPGVDATLREALGEAAVNIAATVDYVGAGTVEFVVTEQGEFYFLEMNTRLQVEHPVTEMITGLDLVEWQLRVAAGEQLPLTQDLIDHHGHSIEVRLYAEDPGNQFLPSVGRLERLELPAGLEAVRLDSGVVSDDTVSPFYDPMLAKVIAWGETRDAARLRLLEALQQSVVVGVASNLTLLETLLVDDAFASGSVHTQYLDAALGRLQADAGPDGAALAAAAVMVMQRRGEQARRNAARRGDGQSPWADTDSWRLGSASWQPLAFDTAGQSYAFAARWNGAGALTILNEGVESTWTARIEGNRVRLGSDAGQTRHRVWVDGERVEVTGEGRRHQLTLRAALGVVGSNQEEQQALTAPMAGKVIESRVQPGDRVNEGDTLMVVEAMKMEHRIIAAHDGVIEMVLADVGDFVEGNAVLLRFADDT